MIRIKKDDNDLPADYLAYIALKKYRKADFDVGHHSKLSNTGSKIFKKIKNRKPEFDNLKLKLLNDQGYICCYCNERIEFKGSVVEHIVPKGIDKSYVAEYSNLLVSCSGGKPERESNKNNMAKYPLYCDAHRNNNLMPFSPLDSVCESAFLFSPADGSIAGIHKDGQTAIETLNLDCLILRRKRMDAYTLIFDENENFVTEQELESIWDNLWERDSKQKHERFFFPILNIIYDII